MAKRVWERLGRLHYDDDKEWKAFDKKLMDETCDFEEAFALTCLTATATKAGTPYLEWAEGTDEKKVSEQHKKEWTKHMTPWLADGKEAGRALSSKPPKFAGMAMAVATLPFDLLVDNGKLPTRELEMINWFRLFYEMPNIPWSRAPATSYDGPPHPPEFEQWMNRNHNRATWWINYSCYERAHQLESMLSKLE